MSNREIEILDKEVQKNKYRCKRCGNREFIPRKSKRSICRGCGYWVYKNSKDEFENRLLEEIKNGNKF